jgi:hypothetical protein
MIRRNRAIKDEQNGQKTRFRVKSVKSQSVEVGAALCRRQAKPYARKLVENKESSPLSPLRAWGSHLIHLSRPNLHAMIARVGGKSLKQCKVV